METVHYSNTAYIYQKIYELLSGQFFPSWDSIKAFFAALLIFIKPFSLILSLLLLTGIIYCVIRTREILSKMKEKTHGTHHASHAEAHSGTHAEAHHEPATASINKRWEEISAHINSDNPSNWRLAILECDIVLDEMLTKMSYRGETLSDKLKAVEKSDFLSIDKAWEAHRVRNTIAHEGSNFQITDREARRVVGLYEEVFREFHYI